jgi:hypothetical protein
MQDALSVYRRSIAPSVRTSINLKKVFKSGN